MTDTLAKSPGVELPRELTGESIVCFAKNWGEDPTSVTHVMVQLARNNRVLWLNSVGTRAPRLASGRDIKTIVRKLFGFFRGAKEVRPNLWVYTPLVLPLPNSRWAKIINRWILGVLVGVQRRKLGMEEFQLWTFLPNTNGYIGRMGESLSVYYCTDQWSKFAYLDEAKVAQAEQDLIRRVNIVFATAQSLVDDRIAVNPATHLARHGVDHELFAKALDEQTLVPPDLACIVRPILGFYGLLQHWIDLDLLQFLAEKHPEWSIVLIGKSRIDTSVLAKHRNIHILGWRPYESLPSYCKGFDVGIIPFRRSELVHHVNPLKLREYLSAGLHVVSTALPEVRQYGQFCTSADTFEEFERAIEDAVKADSTELRKRRSDSMQEESWQAKVREVGAHVMRLKSASCTHIPAATSKGRYLA